jgi:class 3 adenylate cyclase
MARRFFTKHIDLTQFQEHVSPTDYGSEIELGKYVSHECSILFFDLVNFTNISWSSPNDLVFSILDSLFTKVTEEIYKAGGMIDKFPGDGVVCFIPRQYWLEKNLIVDNAIDCATKVMKWFYNEFRDKIQLSKSSHILELCVGIDSGSIAIAHVGTSMHSELILLGDQVNCASKCQQAANKREIVIGQEALNNTFYKNLYLPYLSTGPNTGVVYTSSNEHYLSKRFDWEKYAKNSTWI